MKSSSADGFFFSRKVAQMGGTCRRRLSEGGRFASRLRDNRMFWTKRGADGRWHGSPVRGTDSTSTRSMVTVSVRYSGVLGSLDYPI